MKSEIAAKIDKGELGKLNFKCSDMTGFQDTNKLFVIGSSCLFGGIFKGEPHKDNCPKCNYKGDVYSCDNNTDHKYCKKCIANQIA